MNLADILKDSNYKLSQFAAAEIEQLEQTITLKATKSSEVPYTVCLVRQKAIKLTPEEVIRLNTLDYKRWKERLEDDDWQGIYDNGFRRLRWFEVQKNDYKAFAFDIVTQENKNKEK